MHPGDRLVCAFINPVQVGDTFSDWPLHLTIVPWFRADIPTPKLKELFSLRVKMIGAINAVTRGEERFGHKGSKRVNLVGPVAPFKGVEYGVREVLHDLQAWLADETTRQKRQFIPHVTHQKSGSLSEGSTFVCNSLYIVEQRGGHKQIVDEIPLAS